MARYDKYNPISGGFRAKLAADFTTVANFGKVYAVSLNASGLLVIGGAGGTGVCGLLVLTEARFANDVVDVMTQGEITDLNTAATPFDNFMAAGVVAAPVAGKKYFGHAAADGAIDDVATANYAVGYTVEATRLVVRVANHAAGG